MFEIPETIGIVVVACMLLIGMLAIACVGAYLISLIDVFVGWIRERHKPKRKRLNRCLHCNKIHTMRYDNDFFCSEMCEYLHTNTDATKGEPDEVFFEHTDRTDDEEEQSINTVQE